MRSLLPPRAPKSNCSLWHSRSLDSHSWTTWMGVSGSVRTVFLHTLVSLLTTSSSLVWCPPRFHTLIHSSLFPPGHIIQKYKMSFHWYVGDTKIYLPLKTNNYKRQTNCWAESPFPIDRANEEIAQVRSKANAEGVALNASLRKEQMKVESLERAVLQKVGDRKLNLNT